MPTRKQLISQIWVYEKRRDILKKKYPGENRTKKINKKLIGWRREIKRIDQRNEIINTLVKNINEFFNVDIRTSCIDKKHRLARNIYFKIGMEFRMKGTYFARAIGRKNIHTAATQRRVLNKSFQTNATNKEAYHNFKDYMDKN